MQIHEKTCRKPIHLPSVLQLEDTPPIARCGSERNGVRPKEAEPPSRALGEGCFSPTGRTSALDLEDSVSTFELRTKEYRGTAVESPYRRNAPTPKSYDRKLQLLTGISDEGQPPGPFRPTTAEAGAENVLSRLQSPG